MGGVDNLLAKARGGDRYGLTHDVSLENDLLHQRGDARSAFQPCRGISHNARMSLPPPKVLALIPPMTQLNTPYPATAYLSGFLRSREVPIAQADLALELVLSVMTEAGLQALAVAVEQRSAKRRTEAERVFLLAREIYAATVEPVIAFLQGRDATLAHRIVSRRYLPEGPRFAALAAYEGDDPLAWAFGALGTQDRARHFATLYLNDIADVIRDAVDPGFEFVRYGEKLAASQSNFDSLARALARRPKHAPAQPAGAGHLTADGAFGRQAFAALPVSTTIQHARQVRCRAYQHGEDHSQYYRPHSYVGKVHNSET